MLFIFVCNYKGANSSTEFIIVGVARMLHSVKKMSTKWSIDYISPVCYVLSCMSTTGMLSYTFVWIVPPQMTHGNGDGLSSDQVLRTLNSNYSQQQLV